MSNVESCPAERRRHPRTHLSMTLSCIRMDPDGGDTSDSVRMTDISLGGLGGICGRPFYRGQRVLMRLPIATDGQGRHVYATIIRCRRDESGNGYKVGLEFDAPYVASAYGYGHRTAAAVSYDPAARVGIPPAAAA